MPVTHMGDAIIVAAGVAWFVVLGIVWELLHQVFGRKDEDSD